MVFNILMYGALIVIVLLSYFGIRNKYLEYYGEEFDWLKERYVLLAFIYPCLFLFTSGFHIMGQSYFNWRFVTTNQTFIFYPFQELVDIYKDIKFYTFLEKSTDWAVDSLKVYVFLYIGIGLSLVPLVFILKPIMKKWLKTSLIAVVLFDLLCIVVGYWHITTIVILSVVGTLLAIGLFEVIQRVCDKIVPKYRENLMFIIMCLLLLVMLGLNIEAFEDRTIFGRYQREEPLAMDVSYTGFGGGITLNITGILPEEEGFELVGNVEDTIKNRLPYRYKSAGYNAKYGINGESQNHGSSGGSEFRMYVRGRYNRELKEEWELYPFEFYGIDEVDYSIMDPALLEQFKIVEAQWVTDEAYLKYIYTYQVPIVQGFESKWLILEEFDMNSEVTKPEHNKETAVIELNSEFKIVEVILCFRDISKDEINDVITDPYLCFLSVYDEVDYTPVFVIENEDFFDQ